MSIQTRIRRDNAANINASMLADSELGHDTTNDRIHVGDGSTQGGVPHVNYRDHQKNSFTFATAGGLANAITLSLLRPPLAYALGQKFSFKATADNTGATTVDINGLGAINIFKISGGVATALAGGEIKTGLMYEITHDGTRFILGGSGGGGVVSKNVVVFSASGTYTKPSNLLYADVEVQGGGGNGGSVSVSASTNANGSGGGGGGYSKKTISATSIGASETVTVGGAGGSSSFGAHCSATGGSAGSSTATSSNAVNDVLGGAGGVGSGGDINLRGAPGGISTVVGPTNIATAPIFCGFGGCSPMFGGGARAIVSGAGGAAGSNGSAGLANSGGGGSGASRFGSNGSNSGGAGGSGIVIVTEYLG